MRAVTSAVREQFTVCEYPLPEIWIEPGRSIVGDAGTTIYTVGSVKDIPGIRKYVSVDGGMTDNLRPALYNARYEAMLRIERMMRMRNSFRLPGNAVRVETC